VPSSDSQHEGRVWDVAIIGAGMGGGFTAYALANAGRDVLLIDRGNEERLAAGTRTSDDQEMRLIATPRRATSQLRARPILWVLESLRRGLGQ